MIVVARITLAGVIRYGSFFMLHVVVTPFIPPSTILPVYLKFHHTTNVLCCSCFRVSLSWEHLRVQGDLKAHRATSIL